MKLHTINDGPVVDIALDELIEHPRNANEGDVGAIGASIEAHGFYGAVIVQRSTGYVLAGNHRLQVARQTGAQSLPVQYVDVNDETALRILVADNRSTRLGRDDEAALSALLQELAATPSGLDGLGYDGDDLDLLLADLAHPVRGDGEVPLPPEQAVTRPGDLWLLGNHRLLCGDARARADYDRLLEDQSPACVYTDPPYGVAIGEKNAALESVGRGTTAAGSLDGDYGIAEVEPLWRTAFAVLSEVIPSGCPYYISGPQGGDLGLLLLLLLKEAGLNPRHILIWKKDRPTFSLGRLDYEYQHEPIIYGWKPGAAHPWHATEPQTSVFEVERPSRSEHHPTMKPIELVEPLIRNSTERGTVVLDPFAGSGTTLLAAEYSGRLAACMEIDPRYCDVICSRWESATGIVPILQATGEPQSFDKTWRPQQANSA